MRVSGWVIFGVLALGGWYAFSVNPTPYEVVERGPNTYRRNRLTDRWQVQKGETWKDLKSGPADIAPEKRLAEVGVQGF